MFHIFYRRHSFTDSSLKNLSEEKQKLKEQYMKQQSEIVQEIIQIAAGYYQPLCYLSEIISKMDVLTAFANVSLRAPTESPSGACRCGHL